MGALFIKMEETEMSNVAAIRNFQPTTMELGDKTRILQFDMNAYAELENRYGSIEKAMDQLQKGGMKDIRMILWVGLIHEEAVVDPETGEPIKYNITPYQVGGWIKNAGMLTEASTKLAEAMNQGMPEQPVEPTTEVKNA
jgi:hypothetical protein